MGRVARKLSVFRSWSPDCSARGPLATARQAAGILSVHRTEALRFG